MGRAYKVDFDGKRVATDVEVGWSDESIRTLPIGPTTMAVFGRVEIGVDDDGNDYFSWVDNTDTTPGAPQTANVVGRRLLNEDGYMSCGHWGVYPSEASLA